MNDHMIRNIIFDFDGTLADTASLIIATMQATIGRMGLPRKTEAECRATIGLRLEEVPSVIWPELGNIGAEYARTYRSIFEELSRTYKVRCFPGVIDTLRQLHAAGYGMAIASSRSRRSLVEYVRLFNLTDCFCQLVGGDDVARGKPAPDPVLAILAEQGWDASGTLTVGDADVDIIMGRAAGTATCAVTYGNGTADELAAARPDFTISHFDELLKL